MPRETEVILVEMMRLRHEHDKCIRELRDSGLDIRVDAGLKGPGGLE